MNYSQKWTVKHEAGGSADFRREVKSIQERLNKDFYGEVNGYLRFQARYLKVNKMGVIFRNPTDLLISNINQKSNEDRFRLLDIIEKTFQELNYLAEKGAKKIYFDMLISNRLYLKNIFEYFGIFDVEITNELQQKKINQKVLKRGKYHSLNEFEPDIQSRILKLQEYLK